MPYEVRPPIRHSPNHGYSFAEHKANAEMERVLSGRKIYACRRWRVSATPNDAFAGVSIAATAAVIAID
jgi:hypothetical protein